MAVLIAFYFYAGNLASAIEKLIATEPFGHVIILLVIPLNIQP